MLKIEALCAGYEDKNVIEHITFNFEDGKKYAIIGPSGIGKTTLINVLSGLKKPSGGTVVSTYKRPSYIFQEPRLFPWLTVLENIKLVCNDEKKATMLLEQLISDSNIEKKYPEELSGGMKQRVAIARALLYDSDIVFMDEPFKGLDEEMRNNVRNLVFDCIKGKTVIIVTHDMNDARLCDHIIRMDGNGISVVNAEESGNHHNE
ncbi:MAG: ABC transporter ATP-binding protein [Clostridia bacterium]|nr:ABC transporter ATP-binding protein [Clostridia bacterium]